AAPRTAGVYTELAAGLLQGHAHPVEEVRGEGARTDACGVGLDDADGAGNPRGPDARTDRGAACGRIRGGDKGVGAVVDVEERSLAALHEHHFALVQGVVQLKGAV